MREGPPSNEAWSPDSGIPPPFTPEYGAPQGAPGEDSSEKVWPGKEQGLPPPFIPEFGAPVPPPLPEELPTDPQEIAHEGVSGMQERIIENPELLSEKEASKRFLSQERQKLAGEIRAARRQSRDKLAALSARTEIEGIFPVEGEMDAERMAKNYDALSVMRTEEANGIAERLGDKSGLSEEDANEEGENIKRLVDNDDKLKALREKLAEHYAVADELSKGKFETMKKSVEQTALRNGVFFVHTIQESSYKRHNELSNVAIEATYEDDTDILLSLEPTISASSIFSGKSEEGKVSGLWSDTGGFILGGGDIQYADRNDVDSLSEGIKNRTIVGGLDKQSIEDIDRVVSKRGEIEAHYTRDGGRMEMGTAYNEFVINNPKVFGYYQPVGIEEDELIADGKYYAGDISTRSDHDELTYIKSRLEKFKTSPELVTSFTRETPELYQEKLFAFQAKVARFKERFEKMAERGNPLYIMTPDKSVYEYKGVNEDGSVNIGKQLTPEEAATGRAGLSVEKRKELGEKVLKKKIFKKQETTEEAKEIIAALSE